MTLLNRKLDYALLILCYLFQHRRGASAREIAEYFGLSRPFLANILKELCQKHAVVSKRGIHGGYMIVDEASEWTLAQLFQALEEPVRLAACNEEPVDSCCQHYAICPIRSPIAEVHRRLSSVLESVTLREIFERSTQPPLQIDVSRCEITA